MTQKIFIYGGIFLGVFVFLLSWGAKAQAAEWCYDFKLALKLGSRGYEAGALQAALQKEGLLFGRLDAVFGLRTKYALMAFQEKYKEEILTPARLKNATAFVGQATRAKLNKLYGCAGRASSTTAQAVPAVPAASVAVVSPNGLEQLNQGNELIVKWTSSGLEKVNIVLINYVTGDQLEIASQVLATSSQYSWPIPYSLVSGQKYKISARWGKTSDLSDNYFSVAAVKRTPAPSLTLLSPLGGEQWGKGKSYLIKWIYQDLDKIDSITMTDYSKNITYSLGGNIGASFNSLDWQVPSAASVIPPGASYKIKIESCLANTCYSDQSDSYFSVVNL